MTSHHIPSDAAPYPVAPDGCGDCSHVKRIHLANVGRCLVTDCTCPTFEPPTAGLHAALENGTWP